MKNSIPEENRYRDIYFILKDLLKVIKVVSMYPENNPLPQSMKLSFAEKLVSLAREYQQIAISVEKDRLVFEKEVVYEDRSKEENLSDIFFSAGITGFTFLAGITVEDVYKLLDAVKAHINSSLETPDLATKLWEADIQGFTFTTIEDITLSEYDENFNVQEYIEAHKSGDQRESVFGTENTQAYQSIFSLEESSTSLDEDNTSEGTEESSLYSSDTDRLAFYAITDIDGQPSSDTPTFASPQMETPAPNTQTTPPSGMTPSGAIPPSAPSADTTLILNEELKLSSEEEATISTLVQEDSNFDVYESTTELLKEMLHQEVEMDGFYETVTICEKVISEFLTDGKLTEASHILRYLTFLEGEIRKDRPLWAERLKDAVITAGSRDRLRALAQALNDHPDVGAIELKQYLENFGWETLNGLTDLLGELQHRVHRETLCDYLTIKAKNHPDIIANGIYDKRWYVVRNTASILARIGDDQALEHLKKVITHDERRVRLEIVKSLKECPNEKALELIRTAALDPDREVRHEAINTLLNKRGRAAFETIASVINDDDFPNLEPSEQKSLLRAFSILGGDAAVSYLSQLILQPNPLRNPSLAFYRRAAFDALTHNQGEKAGKLLSKLATSWRPDIRRQAVQALRKRHELIYRSE